MHKRLNATTFPHFMERSKTYRSNKPLGRIYDRVKTVRFDPIYDMALDDRILSRFQLSVNELTKAREIKGKYDVAMRRLIGRHENLVTEFEIWSTFILSKPRVGNDYKLQEEIGREVAAVKDRFRSICAEAVTGVERRQLVFSYSNIDLEKLDRFVAAMYMVTHDEVQEALRARADDQGTDVPMPLVSFPWLFHRELSRIATGGRPPVRQWKTTSDGSEATTSAATATAAKLETFSPMADLVLEKGNIASKKEGCSSGQEDYVRTSGGQVVHRGETLDLSGEARGDTKASKGGEETDDSPQRTQSQISTTSQASSAYGVNNNPMEASLSSQTEKNSDEEGEEPFEEMEFQEMEMDNGNMEEDALDALTRKIAGI